LDPAEDHVDGIAGSVLGVGPQVGVGASVSTALLWPRRFCTTGVASPGVVSDAVTEAIHKELWRQTGHRIDTAEISRLLTETVLSPASLEART
jgi:hypothetical protein